MKYCLFDRNLSHVFRRWIRTQYHSGLGLILGNHLPKPWDQEISFHISLTSPGCSEPLQGFPTRVSMEVSNYFISLFKANFQDLQPTCIGIIVHLLSIPVAKVGWVYPQYKELIDPGTYIHDWSTYTPRNKALSRAYEPLLCLNRGGY